MTSPLAQAMAFQSAVNPAQSGIAPTDVVGAYKLASDIAERNYQAKLAQANAMWGGLAGLGGSGILAFGPSIARKYFGAGIGNAAGAATPAMADAATGAATGAASGAVPTATSSLLAPADTALAGLGGSVAADMGLGGGAAADAGAGSVLADLGTAGAGAAGADVAASTMPDWLMSFLPFLAA